MILSESSRLEGAWPLYEQSKHFDLGFIMNSAITDALSPVRIGEVSSHHAGCWECNLSDDSLTWSGGVFDIFGLRRGIAVRREDCLAFYCEDSRVKMERLREHAIRYNHGFTLDVEIHPAVGSNRWMRLITVPVSVGGRVTHLQGLKLII